MTANCDVIGEAANALDDLADAYLRTRERERRRAVAAITWVFSADGTRSERTLADEAVGKINDPTFLATGAL